MGPEAMDEFERELAQALERRPAPPGLKRRIMARRQPVPRRPAILWQRMAAGVVLAAMLGGGVLWRERQERRRGEAAREQVLTALRIAGHALNDVNERLASRGRAQQ